MTHQTANVTMVKCSAERFCERISRIDNTRDMFEYDLKICLPLLNRKVLDVNVARTRRGATGINHEYRSCIVLVQACRLMLDIPELGKDRSQVFGDLCGMYGGKEFSFGRTGRDGRLDCFLICRQSDHHKA